MPHTVYSDDPAWVPPLDLERRLHLSEKHNPYFEHARWRGWVAYRDGRAVGRVSAQVDELVLERYGAVGQFGFLEAVDDARVFDGLLDAAEGWLREEGMGRIQGPFNFSINQECGLLVEGFDEPPMVMMGHARPWTREHLERRGFAKAKDLLAYWIRSDHERPPLMRTLGRRYGDRIRMRPLDRSRFEEEMALLREIFNDAWAGNWGFVPFTEAEFEEMGKSLRLIVPDDLVRIAEVEGEAAGFMVGIPNLNEIIADLDGRLLPLGWARLAWRLWRGRITTGRAALMGVRSRHQGTPLGAALALGMIDAVSKAGPDHGITEGELSWILEDNHRMRDIIERIGGEPYKRYRIFEKLLGASARTP